MIETTTATFLFLALLISLLAYLMIGKKTRKHYPKGPIGVPLLGHLPFFGRQPPTTFLKWRQKYGDVFSIRMGNWKAVVLNGYKAIKEAAEKPDDAFSSRPGFTTVKVIEKVQGEISLAFGPFNDTYLQHRKIVATVLRMFTGRNSEVAESLIIEEADKLAGNLLKKAGKGPVDIRSDIQYAAGGVIYQMLYGRGLDVKEKLDMIVENANEFIKFTGAGNPCDVMPWLQYVMPWKISVFSKILSRADAIRMKQIQQHIDEFSSSNIANVTDALLAADLPEKNGKGSGLTRSRLVNTTGDLQGAGFDTSNKTLQWLILYMSTYPEVQKRVQNEIDDVIGSGRMVELKDRSCLVYTEATILEVMRITAIAPFALPKFTIKDTSVDGYDIDKGTVVFFNIHSISHDKEFWGDPENFRPERLINENNQLDKSKCNHIVPFGLGRRRCVGEFLAKMEMFLLFTNVISRCEFAKPEGETYDLEPVPGLVYSPKQYRVLIRERQ